MRRFKPRTFLSSSPKAAVAPPPTSPVVPPPTLHQTGPRFSDAKEGKFVDWRPLPDSAQARVVGGLDGFPDPWPVEFEIEYDRLKPTTLNSDLSKTVGFA